MEGIPGWFLIGIFVVYGLAVVALLPALAAVGYFLARRPQHARMLFAAALLGEAVVWAAFCFLLLPASRHADAERLLDRLPIELALMGLSLLLAGGGQFVAALRGPRTWTLALALAAGAVLVVLARDRPAEWLDWLPDWNSLAMAGTSLLLATASLLVALLHPADSRQPKPAGPENGRDEG